MTLLLFNFVQLPAKCFSKMQKVKEASWTVVSTHLKNITQIGSFPQVGVKIKKYLSCHHPNLHLLAGSGL